MTRTPLRVRAWGRFMTIFAPYMHVHAMSMRTIEADQNMWVARTPIGRALFGRRATGIRADDRAIPGPNGDIPIRVYTPERQADAPRPIVLYFHGGGWVLFGGRNATEWAPSRVASELDAVVISVDYRLAPQNRYPGAVEDCYAALEWAAANARTLGAASDRIAVMGDSAGGNLSAVMAILSRDRDGPRLRAQALIYPVTDATLSDDAMLRNANKPILTARDMHAFVRHYVGDQPSLRMDPLVSPIFARNLVGLPPALVQVAEHDVLHDQGVAYAERMRGAGTAVTLVDYAGAPHGWVTYPYIVPTSRPAMDDLVAFLREHVA